MRASSTGTNLFFKLNSVATVTPHTGLKVMELQPQRQVKQDEQITKWKAQLARELARVCLEFFSRYYRLCFNK
jgi:hypothetical protein